MNYVLLLHKFVCFTHPTKLISTQTYFYYISLFVLFLTKLLRVYYQSLGYKKNSFQTSQCFPFR